MDKRGAIVEDAKFIQPANLGLCRTIGSFGRVEDEGRGSRRLPMSRSEIRAEIEGMRPAATSHHPDRKWDIEHSWLVRVVMRHSGDARQQILQAAPLQPHALRNRQVLFNGRGRGAVDIFSPGSGIWIWAPAKARKEI